MSTIATPPIQTQSTPASSSSSAWSRGPPTPSSTLSSGAATPLPPQNGLNGSAAPSSHSRKGSIMVGGGVDIKKGPINFGTMDAPLSSSPAAPSTLGMHLTDAVKSFGSIEADNTEANAIKPPSRRASTLSPPLATPAPEKKKLDVHSFFNTKVPPMQTPQPDRRLSQSGFQQPNGQLPQNGTPYQMRPDAYMQQGFRPPQPMMPQGQVRPNGMPRPMPQYPQAQYMQYPGYYYGFDQQQQQQQQQYPQQWAPQQHPQNFRPPPQPSPAPSNAQLPNSGGPSPVPTPPVSRPPSMMPPSTPSRPITMQQSFTPQQPQFSMSGGAPSFTPRVSKALKISRPDGTELNIKDVAAAAKGPSPAPTPALETPAPAAPAVPVEIPAKKKMPSLPVIVRIESEEQKKARLAEEEQRERIRKVEEQEEKERKERKERQAREEAERKAKEAQEAEEAERRAEEQRVAEQKRKEEEDEQARQEAAKKAEDEAAAKAAEEAKEAARVEEANKATPTESPIASPSLGGLPPKPDSRRPASLELNTESSIPTPLSTAKPIADLQSIVYPSSYKPPSPDLNKDAQPGKYRYDRDFLMQFMSICREKPEGLPPLDEIGLEADSSSGFGNRTRGGRPSMPPPRGAPAGLGIRQPSGMGAFAMGSFGAGSVKGTTSESRYAQSLQQMQMGMGPRSTSKGALPTMPMLGGRGSGSSRGKKRPPPILEPGVAPLAVSSNSWVKARPTNTDEKEPAYIERKVKALLNKLTEEKFESISNQILDWANKSRDDNDGLHLKLVIKQVFEKATDEAHWSAMYAKLCRKLLERLDPEIHEEIDDKTVSGGTLFRRYLLGRCQMDFESGWKAREEAAAAAAAKSAEDKELLATQKEGEEIVMLSDEYYIAQKAKRRGLGLVQLIGELFKLEMISKNVIRTCMLKLVGERSPELLDEEDVESACKLLTTIGEQYEQKSPEDMRIVIGFLQKILQADVMPSRVRFMIMDVLDLKKTGWRSRNKQAGVMTIAEIHQQAAREQAEKAAAAQRDQRESISRGGSRAGHARQQPGEWQNAPTGARPVQRMDTSNLGRNFSSSGMSSGPSFGGPQSHFAKKRPGAAGATPPMSRQASTTNMSNMFNVLGAEEEKPAEPEVQRPKLNLKPRTKPLPGEDGAEDADGAEEDGEAEDGEKSEASEGESEGEKPMSATAAQAKIASDSKELWGEKDQGGSRNPSDIVAYFETLPEEHKHLLAEHLVDDLFRICKIKDAELVASGWASAVEQNAVSPDSLKKGIEKHMPSLDDDSIDFPKAYAAIAMLMRSISLSEDDITALLEMVDVYGEPRVTPKDKLDKELAALDSASA